MSLESKLTAIGLSLLVAGAAQAKPAKKPAKAKLPGLSVTIETKPSGAKVYVDGKKNGIVCQSGPSCKPLMSRGIHKILLELDGYKTSEESINVGTTRRFSFTLKAAPARLEIKALAAGDAAQGAEIYVDGVLSGTVPTTVSVPAGKHKIEVRRSGLPNFAEEVEVTAGSVRPLVVRLQDSTKAPATAAPTPAPTKAGAPTPPPAVVVENAAPAAPEKGVQVTIVPRNPRYVYVISSNRSKACQTPCIEHIEPGPLALTVSGPGSKQFWQQITILNAPTQITVQHYTKSRAIAGSILLILGLPMAAVGGIFLANGLGNNTVNLAPGLSTTADLAIGGVLAGHGLIFTIAGLVELGTIKYNTIKVTGTGVTAALEPRSLRFLGAGIAPTQDRSGAGLAASFAF